MNLEIVPGIGIGPIHLGMTPAAVLALFHEDQRFEDWMGGNLNDSLLFHGLLFMFDKCDTHGPLRKAHLDQIAVHQREDATLFGAPVSSWHRPSILERLRRERCSVAEMPGGWLRIREGLGLEFAASGEIDRIEILGV